MSKYITIYQPNSLGEIEKIEMIDGVVVQEGWEYPRNGWDNVWSFFYSHGATGGGNEWEARYKENHITIMVGNTIRLLVTGNIPHPPMAKQIHFNATMKPLSDYQGSVPVWDGYNGE